MATKKLNLAAAAAFVSESTAPQAAATTTKTNEKAIPINVTFPPALLASIDALAKRRGMSRATFIKTACSQCLERGGV